MLSALVYLRATSFKNWLLTRLRSLRRPKQLAGALMFALYFWFFFLRHWGSASPAAAMPQRAAENALAAANVATALPTDWQPAAAAMGAIALLIFAAFMWVVPTQRAALNFSEAEIAFLFPAPVTRPALVHFRLLSAQLRSLVGACVMMLISNRWTFLGGNAFTHALGWWFVFAALNLHHSAAGFTLTRLADAGLRVGIRRLLVLAAVGSVIGLTWWRLPASTKLPAPDDPAAFAVFAEWMVAFTSTAPLHWLLWPFRWVLGPFLAADTRAFVIALAPALVVLAIHYFWVVKNAVGFEESSIQQAQRRSARIAAWRSGQRQLGDAPAKSRRDPFRLTQPGRPELAFLWKNLLATWPYFNLRVFSAGAFVITAACFWLHREPTWRGILPIVAMIVASFSIYALAIGPQFLRQDFRSDLAHADILKTYPLPGWQIVLGELLTPVVILTGLIWLMVLTLTLTLTLPPTARLLGEFSLGVRLISAFWLALITPFLVTLQMLVPNAATLLFPGWFQASRGHGGGPEVAGQRMIFFFAQLVTMLLALLPPTALAALLFFIFRALFDVSLPWAVNLAAVPFLLILLGEVVCGVWLLGQRFERFDLSAEVRT